MVRGVHSKRNLLASDRRYLAGFFTGLALVLSWAPPATAEDQAQGWFDPSRFTLRQSINTLTTTTTNPNGTSSAGHAYVSETELDYRVTDWYQLALVASASLPGSLGGAGSWNGALLRQTFLVPDAGARPVFVGLAVQFGYMAPGAAVPALASTNTRFAAGLTPILGFNYQAWQLILSPTVVTGIGARFPGAAVAAEHDLPGCAPCGVPGNVRAEDDQVEDGPEHVVSHGAPPAACAAAARDTWRSGSAVGTGRRTRSRAAPQSRCTCSRAGS